MDLLRGDAPGAKARLHPLVGTPGWDDHLTFLLALAWTYLENGDVGAADEAAAGALREASRQRVPVGQVEALRLQGMIAGRQGHWQAAAGSLGQALERAREIAYPWGEARTLYALGVMDAHHGRPDQAREHLRRAEALFARLGAHAYRKDAELAIHDL
jgi:Flp pilus assembly protein TadD